MYLRDRSINCIYLNFRDNKNILGFISGHPLLMLDICHHNAPALENLSTRMPKYGTLAASKKIDSGILSKHIYKSI